MTFIYVSWNLTIVKYTGVPIYKILDFKTTLSYIFILAAVTGLMMMFMFGWIIDFYFKSTIIKRKVLE